MEKPPEEKVAALSVVPVVAPTDVRLELLLKKRRREDLEDEDVEMGDAEATTVSKNHKRKTYKPLGHEFKAKV